MPYLCTILEYEADCTHHEDIVDLLYEINDPRCVPSLAKALYYERSDDPTRELNIKILNTLDSIGTTEALVLIQGCLDHPSEKVRREAREIVEYRKQSG